MEAKSVPAIEAPFDGVAGSKPPFELFPADAGVGHSVVRAYISGGVESPTDSPIGESYFSVTSHPPI